jgi:hypothetical protein
MLIRIPHRDIHRKYVRLKSDIRHRKILISNDPVLDLKKDWINFFSSNRSIKAGKKVKEKKNSSIIPAAVMMANSFMGGLSFKYREEKPTAVVRDVKKQGLTSFLRMTSKACSLSGNCLMTVSSSEEKI